MAILEGFATNAANCMTTGRKDDLLDAFKTNTAEGYFFKFSDLTLQVLEPLNGGQTVIAIRAAI